MTTVVASAMGLAVALVGLVLLREPAPPLAPAAEDPVMPAPGLRLRAGSRPRMLRESPAFDDTEALRRRVGELESQVRELKRNTPRDAGGGTAGNHNQE